MANGLFCSENLPVTPKLRHDSNDSNSENTPPELLLAVGKKCDLLCTEVMDEKELQKPVLQHLQPYKQNITSFNHPPVKSSCDSIILKDDRVLQNLLRNEERYMPAYQDYFKFVQVEVKPHMRKIVADWMLEVCEETRCSETPEVFSLAMNYMDRFLAQCRISKSQLQLLGAASLFLASKFKAIDHISSEKLVMYTDFSITAQELKDWELLVLHKLRWELSSTTANDYLDHIIHRLCLPESIDINSLRAKTETIIALAATDYHFSYKPPSLMAATSILTALRSCSSETKTKTGQSLLNTHSEDILRRPPLLSDKILKDAKMCLQILTLAGSEDMECCYLHMAETLPVNLTGHMCKSEHPSPDTTMAKSPESNYKQDGPTLETVHGVSSTVASSNYHSTNSHLTSTPSREQTPGFSSAVDVFSDFNSSVLQAVLSPNDSYNSILVT